MYPWHYNNPQITPGKCAFQFQFEGFWWWNMNDMYHVEGNEHRPFDFFINSQLKCELWIDEIVTWMSIDEVEKVWCAMLTETSLFGGYTTPSTPLLLSWAGNYIKGFCVNQSPYTDISSHPCGNFTQGSSESMHNATSPDLIHQYIFCYFF